MKWFTLFSAALTLFFADAFAQQPDIAQVLVHYKFSHLRDTTNRNQPYTDNTVLLIGKDASAYRRYDKQFQQALTGEQPQQPIGGPLGNAPGGSICYQFFHEKKMVRKEPIFTADFLISETLPVINWQVTRDTATFGSLHCQKATTHFKGRDYIAWFCPALPLPAGPWKLNGLPGVIIEAYDAKKEVSFTFDGIEKLGALVKKDHRPSANDPTILKVPANATPTTEKEFTKLQETFRKDPEAFMRMVNGAGDGSGRQMHIDIKPGPPPVNNNPIELTENK